MSNLKTIWGMTPLNVRLIVCYNVAMSVTQSAAELTTLFCYAVWGCLIHDRRASSSLTPTESEYETAPNSITKQCDQLHGT
jgi:hypothetical protein